MVLRRSPPKNDALLKPALVSLPEKGGFALTTFAWATEKNRKDMLGLTYQHEQILMVTGPLAKHFYEWCMEISLGVSVIRISSPMDQHAGITLLVFPIKWPDIDQARWVNSAYSRIRSEWGSRPGVAWMAEGFVECTKGERSTRKRVIKAARE